MESGLSFKAAIIGATGVIGRKLIDELMYTAECELITILARRKHDEWADPKYSGKLKIVECGDLDKMHEHANEFEGHDVFYCCLGSQVGKGKDLFIKVDKTYPLNFADIAKQNNAKLYVLVSSYGSDSKSSFLYLRTKGETEDELKAKGVNSVLICKPGMLSGRGKDTRCQE